MYYIVLLIILHFQGFSDLVQGDHKLVLVVQNGLKMGKGKMAAQVCNYLNIFLCALGILSFILWDRNAGGL